MGVGSERPSSGGYYVDMFPFFILSLIDCGGGGKRKERVSGGEFKKREWGGGREGGKEGRLRQEQKTRIEKCNLYDRWRLSVFFLRFA